MSQSATSTALDYLDALLRQGGIHPLLDLDGNDLVFLHIGCASVSATSERYTLEHLDQDGNRLRTIRCTHEQIYEAADLVRAYRDDQHSHGRANGRPSLRLVKGQRR